MPLSETNKAQSQSIEDLIAQLDAPTPTAAGNNTPTNNHHHQDDHAANSRKMLKGKRTNSTSNSGMTTPSPNLLPNQNTPGSVPRASTFGKANSFGQNSEPVLSKNIIMSKKYTKHLVHLKNKNSMHKQSGKHSWGAPGCELAEDIIDTRDPNYDSEDNANVVMVCVENSERRRGNKAAAAQLSGEDGDDDDDGGVRKAEGDANDDDDDSGNENLKELDADNLESEIKTVILEYFQNGDTIEVIDHLKCYSYSKVKAQLISFLVQLALEHNNTCKELMSRLLRDLTAELFVERDFVRGFDQLLGNIDDLTLDNPDAPEAIGTFIARSIADKVVTKSYLDRFFTSDENARVHDKHMPDLSNEKVQKAIESSRLLVNMNDHLYQLSHTWGNKGGFLAVKELSDKIGELIQEFHDSGDVEEAIRCLRELNVPHFHHEFVYEALDFCLQKATDHSIELITNLIKRLCETVIITYDQMKIGFTRIFAVLPDICLDVPNANALMDKILNQCSLKGFISDDIIDLAPNRSRKRFVSEGDGGRIKE